MSDSLKLLLHCQYHMVDQGVKPSQMDEPLYLSLGYKVIGDMQVLDDGKVKGFTQRVTEYQTASKAGAYQQEE